MATSDQLREWAAANGHQVNGRGRVPRRVAELWDAAHPADLYEVQDRAGMQEPLIDYPDDEFDTAFTDPAAGMGETAPVRPRAKPGGSRGFLGRGGGQKKGGRKPRVSTAKLIDAVWRGAAGVFRPVPSMNRILRVQAPVAGMLLDDVVKGTIVDTALQPFARLADKGGAVSALMGPPLFMGMYEAQRMRMMQTGQPPNPLMMTVAEEGLRQSLMVLMDIAGPEFEKAAKREAEQEERYGSTVDGMIAWLLSPPADPEQEEANIRRAQGHPDA